jgi:hypothetical protein
MIKFWLVFKLEISYYRVYNHILKDFGISFTGLYFLKVIFWHDEIFEFS